MNLSSIVVDVVGYGEASALHNHRDWMMCLFAVQKFGKIVLDPKNERFSFLRHDIYNPCENTHDQSAVQKKNFFMGIIGTKKMHWVCSSINAAAFTWNQADGRHLVDGM